jgi:hypothetical protein
MVGRAADLGVYTMGQDPRVDPLIVEFVKELRPRRRWRVLARAKNRKHAKVEAISAVCLSRKRGRYERLSNAVVDLTAALAEIGYTPIGARGDGYEDPFDHWPQAEPWHFQNTEGLEEGLTTFGDELLIMHGADAIGTEAWTHRARVWGEDWR